MHANGHGVGRKGIGLGRGHDYVSHLKTILIVGTILISLVEQKMPEPMAVGKLHGQPKVAAYDCPTNSGRLFISNRHSKMQFLVDTGSDLCVYPRSAMKTPCTQAKYSLTAANGSVIHTY